MSQAEAAGLHGAFVPMLTPTGIWEGNPVSPIETISPARRVAVERFVREELRSPWKNQ